MAQTCTKCGAQIQPGIRFCEGCGAPAIAAAPLSPPPQSYQPPPPPSYAPPSPPSFAPPPQPQETMWHYTANGSAQGPMAETELLRMLPSLSPDTRFWNPALTSWLSAEEAGLRVAPVIRAPQFAPPPPAPVPPPAPRPGAPFNAPSYAPVNTGAATPYPGYGAPQTPMAPPPGFAPAPLQPPYGVAPASPYAASAPMSMAGGPEPPNMHWFLILALSFFTGGLAGFVWLLRESLFVKKIDAASKAVVYWVVLLVAMVVQVILYFKALSPDSASGAVMASSLIMLLNLVIMVIALVMVFSMRKSIVTYYNTAEPIGLKLSGVMTFFFSILYFQYHFSRIIRWKKTGVLS